jgi:hypothetical protein
MVKELGQTERKRNMKLNCLIMPGIAAMVFMAMARREGSDSTMRTAVWKSAPNHQLRNYFLIL